MKEAKATWVGDMQFVGESSSGHAVVMDVPPAAVEQAIELSEKKYCSVSAMLSKTARITTRYRIEGDEKENESPQAESELSMRCGHINSSGVSQLIVSILARISSSSAAH
jgi:hypothetical protein